MQGVIDLNEQVSVAVAWHTYLVCVACVQNIAVRQEELDQPSLSVERRKWLEEAVQEYERAIKGDKEAVNGWEEEIKEREIALRQLNCKYQDV